jgi:hypothetical protein
MTRNNRVRQNGEPMKNKKTATKREVPWISFRLARNSTECMAFIDAVFALKDRCAGLTPMATKRAVITATRHDFQDGIFFDHDNGGEKIRNVLFHFVSTECSDCYERLVSEATLDTGRNGGTDDGR